MRAQPWHAAPCRSLSCACSEGAPTTRPRRPEPYDRGRVRYLARFDPETVRALVRAGEVVPSPSPSQEFATGDKIVVVGTQEGVRATAELLQNG